MMVRFGYDLIRDNTWGKTWFDVVVDTGITGYTAVLEEENRSARLESNGFLYINSGFEWDFGSGPALQTPSMVRASLVHDVLCDMTNARLLPWKVRRKADALFRRKIKKYSPRRPWYNPFRYNHIWRWASVAAYSQLIARWRDKVTEDEPLQR